MSALRRRPKGTRSVSFGFSALVFALLPTQIGYQDLVQLIARQPAVAARWRDHLIASPFGTIHAATFSFPRPIGTAIPSTAGYGVASLDPRSVEGTDDRSERLRFSPAEMPPPLKFPTVQRRLKGDPLVVRPKATPQPAGRALPKPEAPRRPLDPSKPQTAQSVAPSTTAFDAAPVDPFVADALAISVANDVLAKSTAASAHDFAEPLEPVLDKNLSLADARPEIGAFDPYDQPDADPAAVEAWSAPPAAASATVQSARLYFGVDTYGAGTQIEPWAPGEAPETLTPDATAPAGDSDIKQSALTPAPSADKDTKASERGGETVAAKGEVTGETKRPSSPAQRLGLSGEARVKAEKCLAEAIYFESRGEPVRGQMAVAQVVINRVFTEFYPKTVCGVVYQNAHRRYRCQFTFACDRTPDVVREPDMWVQAKRIAQDALDGKIWVPEVGKATHYHAYWVHPSWVHEMKRLHKLGVHTFYRPRAWGDGSDIPDWGSPVDTTASIKAVVDEAMKAEKSAKEAKDSKKAKEAKTDDEDDDD